MNTSNTLEILDGTGHLTKFCPACGSDRPTSEFYHQKGSPDGFRNRCKDCMTIGRSSQCVSKGHGVWKDDLRKCPGCGLFKGPDEYFSNKHHSHGRSTKCRLCHQDEVAAKEQALRYAALRTLGNRCVRCGLDDTRALHIDHIKGNGREEYRRLYSRGVYRRVIAQPEDYQVLCLNCNHIKRIENGEHGGRRTFE